VVGVPGAAGAAGAVAVGTVGVVLVGVCTSGSSFSPQPATKAPMARAIAADSRRRVARESRPTKLIAAGP